MEYLVTGKKSPTSKPHIQRTMTAQNTLNMVAKMYATLQRIDDTSAGLKAMKFMKDVDKSTGAKAIENTNNGHIIVIQKK